MTLKKKQVKKGILREFNGEARNKESDSTGKQSSIMGKFLTKVFPNGRKSCLERLANVNI